MYIRKHFKLEMWTWKEMGCIVGIVGVELFWSMIHTTNYYLCFDFDPSFFKSATCKQGELCFIQFTDQIAMIAVYE